MAKEYIERKAALMVFEKVCDICMALVAKPMCGDCSIADTVRKVKSIPAADVVEVVRCKDCKYRRDDNFCGGRGWPEQLVPDDGYCDKGARKEGDGDV